jgi:hypothetical protein
VTSADELLDRLAAVWPAFRNAAYVVTTSTSSGIQHKTTREWLVPPYGMHLYPLVAGDVARFREALKVRLWLAGEGFCKLASPNAHTGVAAILERALIDLTVMSPERLDYIAGAEIPRHAPFVQVRDAPVIRPGGILDLDTFPDLTADERTAYDALVAKAKARLAPEQHATIRTRIRSQQPTMDDTAVDEEVARRLDRAIRSELTADHPLFFTRKQCTAGTLTHAQDGKRLRDPLEPDYGPSQAVFHWNDGDWRIVSWAHGVKKVYRLAGAQDEASAAANGSNKPQAAPAADLPVSKRYYLTERGLYYIPPPDREGQQPEHIWVCAPLHIAAATEDETHDNHGHLLEFHDRHGHPQRWGMPLALLEEQREYRKVLRRLGLMMNGSRDGRDLLQQYLDVCRADRVVRCVERVGWQGQVYVLPDATIGSQDGGAFVLQSLDNRSEGYRQGGTLEGWRHEVAARCVGNSRLLLAVSAGFAAPLLTLTGDDAGGGSIFVGHPPKAKPLCWSWRVPSGANLADWNVGAPP